MGVAIDAVVLALALCPPSSVTFTPAEYVPGPVYAWDPITSPLAAIVPGELWPSPQSIVTAYCEAGPKPPASCMTATTPLVWAPATPDSGRPVRLSGASATVAVDIALVGGSVPTVTLTSVVYAPSSE